MGDTQQKEVAGLVAGLTVEDATKCNEILGRLRLVSNAASDSGFARALGLKQSSISTAKSRGMIPPSWIVNAANLFNVSSDWLIFGGDFKELLQQKAQLGLADDYVKIPRVATELAAGAGSFIDSVEVIEELAFRRDWLARKGQLKHFVVMTVYGDSMEPALHDKDIALINLSQIKPHTGHIYAVGHDDALFIKRLVCEPGRLIMRSDNSNYADIVLDYDNQAVMDKVKIIGRIVWWCHEEQT